MFKYFVILFLLLLLAQPAFALEKVSGVVVDENREPIEGVNITIDGQQMNLSTSGEGLFSIDLDLSSPRFLTFSHVSYQPVMIKAVAGKSVQVVMKPVVYPMQGITVSAERAQAGRSPIAYSDFTSDDIERDYMLSEFPLLLETTPNAYAYSDAGGGLGYSYLKIRGFDDKRISTYVNGVPLNDPEDQMTYYVDLPDFAANVKDIQIQRGIGNSLYGDASFGGAINIVSGGLEQKRQIILSTGYGGFWDGGEWIGDMQKQSVEYHSGLIDGRWNFSGRYSRQLSDGYRENSWYDGWSYYFSLSRLDPRVTTTFTLYGGPMRMHLAYYGVYPEKLEENRRYNSQTYENETDNFNQPHYQLHNTIKLSDDITLHNSFYHVHGRGYYETYKTNRKSTEYNLPARFALDENGDTIDVRRDLVRQKWVEKNQWGVSPRFEFAHDKGTASLGAHFYYFESEHWGQVVWAEEVTNSIDPRHRYYEYFGEKLYFSLYAIENYQLTERLMLMANLQLKHQTFNFDQTAMGAFDGQQYDLDWTYLSPRFGVVYALNDRLSLLGNYSLSFRPPTDDEIYDADDPDKVPVLDVASEKVHDFEIGANYIDQRQSHSINLYWMEFRNETVPEGGIDDDWHLVTINAERSVHAGIEVSAARLLGENFKLSGNFSYSYNRIKEMEVGESIFDNPTDWGWLEYKKFLYQEKTIPRFPEYIGNLIGDYFTDRFRFTYRARFVGLQYVENENQRELAIDPYMVSSVSASVSFGNILTVGSLVFSVRLDNIFDKEYYATGVGVGRFRDRGDLFAAAYIPAAGRSIFANLKLELN